MIYVFCVKAHSKSVCSQLPWRFNKIHDELKQFVVVLSNRNRVVFGRVFHLDRVRPDFGSKAEYYGDNKFTIKHCRLLGRLVRKRCAAEFFP